jgi:sulfite reductase beta subunit-like hemoprotein
MAQKLAAKPPAADSKTAVIHISGCPKACARPANFDAEILGHADGVTITDNRVTPISDGLRKWLAAAVNDRFTGPIMDQRTP